MNYLRKYATEKNGRLFRNNVGEAWQGQLIQDKSDTIKLKNPRRIAFGLGVGSSDLIGWKTIKVTPDMLGKEIAVFWAVEEKSPGDKITQDQINFLATVESMGGKSSIAKSSSKNIKIYSLNEMEEIINVKY
jgi:hypothetical protein